MPTFLILAVMVITIILAALVVARPALTVARGGKMLAFLAFFIFPVFAGLMGMENHMERSKQTSFCLTCHIMGPYGKSLYVDDSSYIPSSAFSERACAARSGLLYLPHRLHHLRHFQLQNEGVAPYLRAVFHQTAATHQALSSL